MSVKCVARHKTSGTELEFDNVVDREEYVVEEIRDLWVFFFRADNGYEWGFEK